MKVIYNKEQLLCPKTELLDFMLTLSLARLVMISARLGLNGFLAGMPRPKSVKVPRTFGTLERSGNF